MKRHEILRLLSVVVLSAWATAPSGSSADDQSAAPVTELVISPAVEPRPALRYMLVVPEGDKVPGNAVPIYLRLHHERPEMAPFTSEAQEEWLSVPWAELDPQQCARLAEEGARYLQQLQFASRRAKAEWEYTLTDPGQDPVLVMLPDVNQMRRYGRFLATVARGAIKAGQFDAAIDHLQTGYMLARHVGEGPFLVNRLVGIAIAQVMHNRVAELIEQPAAPSLYWALAALPSPLIDVRPAIENERNLIVYKFPELANLDKKRGPDEWSRIAGELRGWVAELSEYLNEPVSVAAGGPGPAAPPQPAADKPETPTPPPAEFTLANAREYLVESGYETAEAVAAMSDDEISVRYSLALWYETYDQVFKWSLAPRTALSPDALDDTDVTPALRGRELYPIVSTLVPALRATTYAMLRNERHRAIWQTVEALRLHAGQHGGKLPQSLDELTFPAPCDPVTERPFSYRLHQDGTAELATPAVGKGDQERLLEKQFHIRVR